MKRIVPILILVAIIAGAARAAEIKREILEVTTGTNAATSVAFTNETIRGFIHEITIDVVTANTTGTVAVVVDPEISTLSNVTLASTAALAADKTYYPVFDRTGTDGTALTDDPPFPYIVCGGKVIFSCQDASGTGIVFKALIKYEEPR